MVPKWVGEGVQGNLFYSDAWVTSGSQASQATNPPPRHRRRKNKNNCPIVQEPPASPKNKSIAKGLYNFQVPHATLSRQWFQVLPAVVVQLEVSLYLLAPFKKGCFYRVLRVGCLCTIWCFMGSLVHAFMDSWLHGFIGSWLHGLTGSWLHWFMGSLLHGFIGSWVHGLMGS